jgi:hypothetical protein
MTPKGELKKMDEDVIRCGNDLRFLEWWLHRHGGDPRFGLVISELAAVTQGAVSVLVSSQITNQDLGREFRAESAKSFVAAANKLAAPQAITAGV